MKAFRIHSLRVGAYEGSDIIDDVAPALSWKRGVDFPETRGSLDVEVELRSDRPARVMVTTREDRIPWPFAPLYSGEHGSVRLRAIDPAGDAGPWTPFVGIHVGLLEPTDWKASFISPETIGTLEDGAPTLFTDIEVTEEIDRGWMWISAHGVFELRVNGNRVGDDVLAPGWTAYQSRLRYHGYDLTDLLRPGLNRLEITLGNGWYRGQLVWEHNRSSYGERLAAIAQLELRSVGGGTRHVLTDETWSARPSHVVFDDLYDGETQDRRSSPYSFVDNSFVDTVQIVDADHARLVPRKGPAVTVTEVVAARSMHRSPSGKLIVDFGQNLVGWVRVTLPPGGVGEKTITIRHAEVLERGELAVEPLRSAKATCRYTVTADVAGALEPHFTFSGFRYAEITGVDDLDITAFSAHVVGSALRRTGYFECSDPMLNQLHANVVWGARGNFLDLPTDCPQRDERLGWTGDIQVFAPTANFLFDTSGFLAGWLEDLAAEQFPDGSVPFVIPDVIRDGSRLAAGWGDAAVVVPVSLYRAYGDLAVLRRQYSSMQAWIDCVERLLDPTGIWRAEGQFGDWLDPTSPPEDASASRADQSVVATAYFARSVRMMAEAADALGRLDDAERYRALASHVAEGFENEFVGADGIVRSDSQTVYALALAFDLISDPRRRALAGMRLGDLVQEAGYTVGTGFLGTPHLLDALCSAGRIDAAYAVLLQTEAPSWLYAVEKGATTIWERWDALRPDGTVNTPVMTSFNHYAYGSVADWMHRNIGGLRPLSPGYERFAVEPRPGGGIDRARVSLDTPRGTIDVRWELVDGILRLELVVPPTATAEVRLPHTSTPYVVGQGTHVLSTGEVAPLRA